MITCGGICFLSLHNLLWFFVEMRAHVYIKHGCVKRTAKFCWANRIPYTNTQHTRAHWYLIFFFDCIDECFWCLYIFLSTAIEMELVKTSNGMPHRPQNNIVIHMIGSWKDYLSVVWLWNLAAPHIVILKLMQIEFSGFSTTNNHAFNVPKRKVTASHTKQHKHKQKHTQSKTNTKIDCYAKIRSYTS